MILGIQNTEALYHQLVAGVGWILDSDYWLPDSSLFKGKSEISNYSRFYRKHFARGVLRKFSSADRWREGGEAGAARASEGHSTRRDSRWAVEGNPCVRYNVFCSPYEDNARSVPADIYVICVFNLFHNEKNINLILGNQTTKS